MTNLSADFSSVPRERCGEGPGVFVKQKAPTCVVSALTVPAKAGAGSVIAVSDTTTNQGGGAVPDLASGVGNSGTASVTIPSSTAPATYYVIAKADADNVAIETTENSASTTRFYFSTNPTFDANDTLLAECRGVADGDDVVGERVGIG